MREARCRGSISFNGGTFPFTATDRETHVYSVAGTYDLKVTVRDDDGCIEKVVAVTITR